MKRIIILFAGFLVAFFNGWLLTEILTVHPTRILLMVFLFTVLTVLNLVLFIYAIREKALLLSLLLGILLFLAGYLINAKIYLSQEDSREIPQITRTQTQSEGHTAVVYFTHGEPEIFSPIGWLNQFREFDEDGIKFIPFVARPSFIYALRQKYLEVGFSHHRQEHMKMLASLESLYRQEGDSTTRFYLSFLDDEPRPDAAVIKALNEGASKIVVATVFVSISNHTAEGKHLIENLDCEKNYGVRLKFAGPMWDSGTLMNSFVDKINARIGNTPKDKVAIALIGHGQPDEWDIEFPTETAQETAFLDGIIGSFAREGFNRDHLGKAWMSFKYPKPYELMEKFVKNGVQKIFYFSAAISADAIHSQSDIPELVNKYPFPPGMEVINMGAWNAHPSVIKAIKETIDKQMAAF